VEFSKNLRNYGIGILIAASMITFEQSAHACRNDFRIRAQNGEHQFHTGKNWEVCSGYALRFQNDGNLVVFKKGRSIWSSNTGGHPNAELRFQKDGNLAIYGGAGKVLWSSNTGGHPNAEFVFQSDGYLVIYGGAGKVLWNSNKDR